MNRAFIILFFPVLMFLIYSCASTSEWKYGENAIHIAIRSSPQLNLYKGNPHTLLLCVYQLRDPNAFNQLVDEDEGLSKLLECSRFDPGVVSSRRLVIQPGKEISEVLDRSESAKYVGFVAGYFNLNKEYVVRLTQIPLSFLKNPMPLKVDIYLGPQEILEFRGE